MAPTIHREGGYRFFFFSREEPRQHVPVICADSVAKFWLEPKVGLAKNTGLSKKQIRETKQIVETPGDEFRTTWNRHLQRWSDD